MNLNEIPEKLFDLFKEPGAKAESAGFSGSSQIVPLKGYTSKKTPPFISLLRPNSDNDPSSVSIYNSEDDAKADSTGQLLEIRVNPRSVNSVTLHTHTIYGFNLADPDTDNLLEIINKARELVLECIPARAPV